MWRWVRRHHLGRLMGRIKLKELVSVLVSAFLLAFLYLHYTSGSVRVEDDMPIAVEAVKKIENEEFAVKTDHTARARVHPKEIAPIKPESFVAAVLVICAIRANALQNHMDQLLRLRPSSVQFPVVISQDSTVSEVKDVAMNFVDPEKNVSYMQLDREPNHKSKNYANIAAHYKWALNRMFNEFNYEYVIITEDDLDLAKDFFSYFIWAKTVLAADPKIWCASAWNDNGLPHLVDSEKAEKVWRTDFFPGLGWMLSRELWNELSVGWPTMYWDDWMRTKEVRKGRVCIRPEVPRTAHNMRLAGKGSSGGLYRSFLSNITAAKTEIDFSLQPIETLLENKYDEELMKALAETMTLKATEVKTTKWEKSHSYRVSFSTVREWVGLAAYFGIMNDIRGGMQRTAYYGVVSFMHKGCRVYVLPVEASITNITQFEYIPDWDLKLRFLDFAKVYCKPSKYTGVCDPYSEDMKQWFKNKGLSRKLASWGKMIVN